MLPSFKAVLFAEKAIPECIATSSMQKWWTNVYKWTISIFNKILKQPPPPPQEKKYCFIPIVFFYAILDGNMLLSIKFNLSDPFGSLFVCFVELCSKLVPYDVLWWLGCSLRKQLSIGSRLWSNSVDVCRGKQGRFYIYNLVFLILKLHDIWGLFQNLARCISLYCLVREHLSNNITP